MLQHSPAKEKLKPANCVEEVSHCLTLKSNV